MSLPRCHQARKLRSPLSGHDHQPCAASLRKARPAVPREAAPSVPAATAPTGATAAARASVIRMSGPTWAFDILIAMTFDTVMEYCLGKPGAWQDEPWDGSVVAKVDKKIFAFVGDESVGLKCGASRDEADEWLMRYPQDASVMAYIGRSGWNTLGLNGAIDDDELREAIDDSYLWVVAKLPKTRRPDGWDVLDS